MRKALVTGGAGFIGSHLVDSLLDDGWMVVVLDDLSTGRRQNIPSAHPRLEFVEGDVRDETVLEDIACRHELEVVYHLAAIASVIRSVEDPVGTSSVNTTGALQVGLWAVRSLPKLQRLVFASSAAVYGTEAAVPTSEATPTAPVSPYGLQKATAERYLSWLHDHAGLPAVSCRFFNVFGPRQDPSSPYSGVLSILARALSEGIPFTVHGDGLQSRDLVYVADVVSALRLVAARPEATARVLNVGTGLELTLNEIVDTAQKVSSRSLHVDHDPPRPGDIRRSVADASALRALGWAPGWSLSDGLEALLHDSLDARSAGETNVAP